MDKSLTKDIDFLSAKSILLKEISNFSSIKSGSSKLPEINYDKNESRIRFHARSLNKNNILDCFEVIKNHIENIKLHTLSNGYYCLQALNSNLYDTKSILDNVKFRFSILKNQPEIEITKKGSFIEAELLTTIELFRLTNEGDKNNSMLDPREILLNLGIEVYDPLLEKAKGNTISFDQIFGYEKVKQEIFESLIMPLKNPEAFLNISNLTRKYPSNNRPRAVLFEGEPGVGKTTMAKAVSCALGIPLINVPIESIMSKYFGESAQNLAVVFDAAKAMDTVLIFLDEIDSLAGKREDGLFEATKTMLSVLLRKLDGFEGKPNSITMGATNRKIDLDSALVSRFDKSIYFPLPNASERAAILSGYAMQLDEQLRRKIAEKLEGYSGRKIKDFCDMVERRHVTHLIEKNLPISAPSAEDYLKIIGEI
ncbi:MAG: ATP-binding protein [Leptospiraceae bacterium]|jgi:AAA+ superfamily predicted ATPase|nr:ATP-binding protein [Leptospiraceae bacterium]MCZ8345479.1 ATP-binding protein [Leptospiraceae bacterium]PJD99826.1 MAG: AAA family ATPase [Leptospira sp.]